MDIEKRITEYCQGYYLTHGCQLEELHINFEEYSELMRSVSGTRYLYPTASTMSSSTTVYTSMFYMVDGNQVKISAGNHSMLSYKNGLQKMKERLTTK